ncbi:unnamed protein product, partial [Callosobruchus maculatus]
QIKKYIENVDIVPFKGTFNVHQLSWSAARKGELRARRLSCYQCGAGEKCIHYEIGVITVGKPIYIPQKSVQKLSVEEVYTSESEEDNDPLEIKIFITVLSKSIVATS